MNLTVRLGQQSDADALLSRSALAALVGLLLHWLVRSVKGAFGGAARWPCGHPGQP